MILLYSDKHSSKIVTIVSVVKKGDVPFHVQRFQETHQCTGGLWKIKTKQSFVVGVRSSTCQMSNMRLCQLIVRQIRTQKVIFDKFLHNLFKIILHMYQRLKRNKHIGLLLRIEPIRQLRNVARPNLGIHGAERPGSFRDGNLQRTLGIVGAFRDHAKPIEIHIRAGSYGDERGSGDVVLLDVLFHSGDAERPGGFEDDTGIVVSQLDSITYLIRIHRYHPIHVLVTQPKRLRSDRFHRRSVGEQPDGGQGDDVSGGEGGGHAGGVGGLDAVDFDVRADLFDVGGDSGEHSASSAADEDGVDWLADALFEYFAGNSPLPRNHILIIKRMNHLQPLLKMQPRRLPRRLIVIIPKQPNLHRLPPMCPHGIHLNTRSRHRHANHRTTPQHLRRKCDSLRVIPGGARHDSAT
mmetsp:Transcript_12002/g.22847  ORF Transcript_12002/g.22847 Transcript_12002/m.22847 type:complete len:408 (+) Transcript_12002:538-1761(+)